jgi:hypothetical protein
MIMPQLFRLQELCSIKVMEVAKITSQKRGINKNNSPKPEISAHFFHNYNNFAPPYCGSF